MRILLKSVIMVIFFIYSYLVYADNIRKYPIPYNKDGEKLSLQAHLDKNIVEIWKEKSLEQLIFNLENYEFYKRGRDSIIILSNDLSLIDEYGSWSLYNYKTNQKIKKVYLNLKDGVHLSGAKLIEGDIYYFGSSFINDEGNVKIYPFVKKNDEIIYESNKQAVMISDINDDLSIFSGIKSTHKETYALYWYKGKQKKIPLRAKESISGWVRDNLVIGSYVSYDNGHGFFFYDVSQKKIRKMPINRKCSNNEIFSYNRINNIIFGSCFGASYFLHEELGYIFWEDLSKEFFNGIESNSIILGARKDKTILVGYTDTYIWEMELEQPLIEYLRLFEKKR